MMSTLNSLNLLYNPFKDLTPNAGPDQLFWAGVDDIRIKIERIYNETIRNNSKQVILNWGPYGGGKTYSAFYFLQKEGEKNNLTHLYIKSAKEGSVAVDELLKSIIEYLTFEKVQGQINSIIASIGEKAFISFLTPISGREFAKTIALIGSNDPDIVEYMNRFLYAGLTKAELKKLGLAKDIKTDIDTVKFLTGILACFMGNNEFVNGKVVLWIDEMEDLIYYSPKTYKIFSQVLRELIDNIPDRFCIFMNFTLSEGEENTIELVLGGAVWSRITRKIRFKQFSTEDAEKYCNQLLALARINKDSLTPFDTSLQNEILSLIQANELIPREINKRFNSLISFCLDHDISNIRQDVINKWLEEYSDDN